MLSEFMPIHNLHCYVLYLNKVIYKIIHLRLGLIGLVGASGNNTALIAVSKTSLTLVESLAEHSTKECNFNC